MVSDHANREIDEFSKLREPHHPIVVNLLSLSLRWEFSEDEMRTALIAKESRYWFWLKNSEVLIEAKQFSSFCDVLDRSKTDAVTEYEARRSVIRLEREISV